VQVSYWVASSILLSKPKEQLSVLKKFIEVRCAACASASCHRVQLTDQLTNDRLITAARSGMPAAEQLQLDDGDPLWVEQLFDRASEEAVGGNVPNAVVLIRFMAKVCLSLVLTPHWRHQALPERFNVQFRAIEEVMAPQQNFIQCRRATNQRPPPKFPYFGSFFHLHINQSRICWQLSTCEQLCC
jgi:hypothetical protein